MQDVTYDAFGASSELWTPWSPFDGTQDQACVNGKVMTGILSEDSDGYNDRRFKIRCGSLRCKERYRPHLTVIIHEHLPCVPTARP